MFVYIRTVPLLQEFVYHVLGVGAPERGRELVTHFPGPGPRRGSSLGVMPLLTHPVSVGEDTLVVPPPQLAVAEDAVGVVDLREHLLGRLGALVSIWMVLLGQFVVR